MDRGESPANSLGIYNYAERENINSLRSVKNGQGQNTDLEEI